MKKQFEALAERNEQFTLKDTSTGVKLFTKRQHISQVSTLWDYFYQTTAKVLNYF